MHVFINDLRLSDNKALLKAIEDKEKTLLVYIHDTRESFWKRGQASCSWLHHSLKSLARDIENKGGKLILKAGDPTHIIPTLMRKHGLQEVFFNHHSEPRFLADLQKIQKEGFTTKVFSCQTLFPLDQIVNKEAKPYRVFTPFYRALLKQGDPEKCCKAPDEIPASLNESSLPLEKLHLLPRIPWDKDFYNYTQPGEKSAQAHLKQFFEKNKDRYEKDRNYPILDSTSHLSAHLHFGEISARQIWYYFILQNEKETHPFLREIAWREFAQYLLYHFPTTPLHAFQENFEDFPWKNNAKMLEKWEKGLTGYPIIDASMRQLWLKGWMHNRLRMIVASFLVKDLMIPWQKGAKWFWDTLVDADLANNTLGWQWVAGCGADAAPYFRIFNPITQGEKFDPQAEFIKTYLPELKNLEAKWAHKPFLAPQEVLAEAGVILGKNYPAPIVDHDEARKKALKLYQSWRKRV